LTAEGFHFFSYVECLANTDFGTLPPLTRSKTVMAILLGKSHKNGLSVKPIGVMVVFEGKKTIVFWVGLLVLCAASLFLYSVFWTLFFYPSLPYMAMSAIPVVVGGIFLILTGLILMKSGVKKQKSPTVF
jgi:hypothetical protein